MLPDLEGKHPLRRLEGDRLGDIEGVAEPVRNLVLEGVAVEAPHHQAGFEQGLRVMPKKDLTKLELKLLDGRVRFFMLFHLTRHLTKFDS